MEAREREHAADVPARRVVGRGGRRGVAVVEGVVHVSGVVVGVGPHVAERVVGVEVHVARRARLAEARAQGEELGVAHVRLGLVQRLAARGRRGRRLHALVQVERACADVRLDADERAQLTTQVERGAVCVRVRDMEVRDVEAVLDRRDEAAELGRLDARRLGKDGAVADRQVQAVVEEVQPVAEVVPRAPREVQAVARRAARALGARRLQREREVRKVGAPPAVRVRALGGRQARKALERAQAHAPVRDAPKDAACAVERCAAARRRALARCVRARVLRDEAHAPAHAAREVPGDLVERERRRRVRAAQHGVRRARRGREADARRVEERPYIGDREQVLAAAHLQELVVRQVAAETQLDVAAPHEHKARAGARHRVRLSRAAQMEVDIVLKMEAHTRLQLERQLVPRPGLGRRVVRRARDGVEYAQHVLERRLERVAPRQHGRALRRHAHDERAVHLGRHRALWHEQAVLGAVAAVDGGHDRRAHVPHGECVAELLGDDDVALGVEAHVEVVSRRHVQERQGVVAQAHHALGHAQADVHRDERRVRQVDGVARLLVQPRMHVVERKACRLRHLQAEHRERHADQRRLERPRAHIVGIAERALVDVRAQIVLALRAHIARAAPPPDPVRRILRGTRAMQPHQLLVHARAEEQVQRGIEAVVRGLEHEHAEAHRHGRQALRRLVVRVDHAVRASAPELEEQLLRRLERDDRRLNQLVRVVAVRHTHVDTVARQPPRRAPAVRQQEAARDHRLVPRAAAIVTWHARPQRVERHALRGPHGQLRHAHEDAALVRQVDVHVHERRRERPAHALRRPAARSAALAHEPPRRRRRHQQAVRVQQADPSLARARHVNVCVVRRPAAALGVDLHVRRIRHLRAALKLVEAGHLARHRHGRRGKVPHVRGVDALLILRVWLDGRVVRGRDVHDRAQAHVRYEHAHGRTARRVRDVLDRARQTKRLPRVLHARVQRRRRRARIVDDRRAQHEADATPHVRLKVRIRAADVHGRAAHMHMHMTRPSVWPSMRRLVRPFVRLARRDRADQRLGRAHDRLGPHVHVDAVHGERHIGVALRPVRLRRKRLAVQADRHAQGIGGGGRSDVQEIMPDLRAEHVRVHDATAGARFERVLHRACAASLDVRATHAQMRACDVDAEAVGGVHVERAELDERRDARRRPR